MKHSISYVYVFFLCAALTNTSFGMLSNSTYKPFTQDPNDPAAAIRAYGGEIIIQNSPYVTVKRDEEPGERLGVCYNYVMRKFLKINENLKIMGCNDWIEDLDVLQYFEQIEKPKKNCLAVYTESENYLNIKHFAIVIDDDIKNVLVKSKWGDIHKILQHCLFVAPHHYGYAVSFFTLTPPYSQEETGRALLTVKIKESINQSCFIRKNLSALQRDLYRITDGQIPKHQFFDPRDDTNPCQHLYRLLTRMVGVDINARDITNKTALMLASNKGYTDMVELLIQHGAYITLQDSQRNTALMLATANKHIDTAQFLKKSTLGQYHH